MRKLSVALLSLGLLASACSDSTAAQPELVPTSSSSATKSVQPADAPSATTTQADVAPAASEAVASRPFVPSDTADRTRGGLVNYRGTSRNDGAYYAHDGALHLWFPGEIGPIETSDCFIQVEFETVETPDAVELSIYSLVPGTQPPPGDCHMMEVWSLASSPTLKAPLGDRVLVDSLGNEIPVARSADRLEPQAVPADWVIDRDEIGPLFGSVTSFGPFDVSVDSVYAHQSNKLDGFRSNPLHEEVSILGDLDGVLITRTNGSMRLGFIDAGWFYDLGAEAGESRDELLAFARSFG